MSDRRLRPPVTAPITTTTAAAKRPRKPSLRSTDDDKQRERKRALDRKAQRASREKTRSHIAHLEKMVQILSDKNGSAATSELMDEMSRLHAEIDRLRKIIDSIKSVLGADIFEATSTAPQPQRRISHSPDQDNNSQQSQKSPSPNNTNHINNSNNTHKLCEVNSPDSNQQIQPPHTHSTWDDAEGDEHGHGHGHDHNGLEIEISENMDVLDVDGMRMPAEVGVDLPDRNMDHESNNCTRDTYTWGDHCNGIDDIDIDIDESSVALTSRWDGMHSSTTTQRAGTGTRVFEHTPFWNLPCPLKTGMPDPPVPDFVPCKIWQKANAIYAGIFDYPRDRIAVANKVDAGSLFKVVKEGWGSLSLKERANPVLQILKEVDQNLFWDLDPVTKIANLYKSMLLLKYYFNAEPSNLEAMPNWQRPVHAQKTRRHPIPIDFFPWPALRARLVQHHNYYFATSEFSVHYRQHFKFSWPFAFDDTYRYDAATRQYRISPLFERYHRDMSCWSLEEVFFRKFPELIGEISVFREGGAVGPSVGANASADLGGASGLGEHVNGHAQATYSMDEQMQQQQQQGFGGVSECGFADECVMELFNEYPPT